MSLPRRLHPPSFVSRAAARRGASVLGVLFFPCSACVALLDDARGALAGRTQRGRLPRETADELESMQMEDTRAERRAEMEQRQRSRVLSGGMAMLFVYCVWAVCAYFCFAYSKEIHSSVGPLAERRGLFRGWGIGVGIDQVIQWEHVLRELISVLFVSYVTDLLFLTSNSTWWESYLDFWSMQATLITGYSTTAWQRSGAFFEYNHRVHG